MRQHAAAAAEADLPRPPHLAKETAAAAVANGARRAEPVAPAGHLMQESAMGSEPYFPQSVTGAGVGARLALLAWLLVLEETRREGGRGMARWIRGRGFIGGIEEVGG
jgi:hypothetical protein